MRTSEEERRLRIKLLLAAFSYECMDDNFVDDATFDKWNQQVDLSIETGNPKMDAWFKEYWFAPSGLWIHSLPKEEMDKLYQVYLNVVNPSKERGGENKDDDICRVS